MPWTLKKRDMPWSLKKAMIRVAGPAIAICLMSTIRDLRHIRPLNVGDVLIGNFGVFFLLWLGVVLLYWGGTQVWAKAHKTTN